MFNKGDRSESRQKMPRRRNARLRLAWLTTVGLLAVAAAAAATPWEAPLDTLENVDAPPPWVPRDIQISRNILPMITATELPATTPPVRPPRLDDPLLAALRFQQARRAQAAGRTDAARIAVLQAAERDPARAAYAWWRTWHGLRHWNLDFLNALPRAVRATHSDLAAWKRLILLGHQAAVLWIALFWTLLVVAGLFRYGDRIAHDLAALLLRGGQHAAPLWLLPLAVAALVWLRFGWFVLLAVLSAPLYLHASGRARALLIGTWIAAAAVLYPGWPAVRAALPAVDPGSETVLLSRATRLPPSPGLVQQLETRIAAARNDAPRTSRLRLALGVLAARGGDYDASSRLLGAIVAQDPTNVAALVNFANNDYYQGHYDAAVRNYQAATRASPDRAEIHYNLAQAFAKKLFFKESSAGLARANALGFVPAPFEDRAGTANGFAPVVYLGHDREDLAASADWESDSYPPLAHLSAWAPWLGERMAALFWILGGLFVLTIAGSLRLPAVSRTRPCANCSTAVCPACGQWREDELLCPVCHGTAERARSELVLATLQKNRSRDLEMAFTARAQRFNRILPGGSNLVAGQPLVGLARLGLLTTALLLLLFGWSFNLMATWDLPGLLLPEETLQPLLLPLPAYAWTGPRGWSFVAGLLLAGTLYVSVWLGHDKFRRSRPARLPKQILKPSGWRPAAPGAGTGAGTGASGGRRDSA
jgi:tetratricopeptide (TPR) repeat protein